MKPLRDTSLRIKIALTVSALFIIAAGAIAYWALALFEAEKKASLAGEANDIAVAIAANIDTNLQMAHAAVIAVAATVPPRALEDFQVSEAFLHGQAALHALFDNGLFLVAADGRLIGESPARPARRGSDVSAREYFHYTLQTRKPYISKPYRSTHNPGQPAVIMTAPVFNASGDLIGLLYGSMDLAGTNIVAALSKVRIGKTGYLFMIDGRDTMISHPDPSRIMNPGPVKGQNLFFDKVMDGYEGTGETVNSTGVAALQAFRRLKSTGWLLGVSMPLADFYEPIAKARRYFLVSTAVGTLAFLALVWLLSHRLLTPLAIMTRQIKDMAAAPNTAVPLPNSSRDEIGTLAAAFNAMLDKFFGMNAELEQRVEERTAKLQVANNELQSFSYSVSHDLRAPLRGIDGYSQLLLTEYTDKLDDEGRRYLQNVRKAAQRMGQLIEDLLAYSRLERTDMQTAAVNPRELVEAWLGERAEEIKTRGVTVDVAVPSGVVTADRDGLTMALRNLLENAFKFSRDTPKPLIEIGGRDAGATCILSVRDNGTGFDMKYHDRIFDIFQRLHRSEDYPGTGVGLAIVKKAMARMGGRVWAESEPGKGATFYLEIPK